MKIGVLGGGQLGLMLAQSQEEKELYFLESSLDCPVSQESHNICIGDFRLYDDVLKFGQDKDIITIEIENVNTLALEELEKIGKRVYPQPKVINIIKDKGLQKKFYLEHQIPTSDFQLFENKSEVLAAVENGKLRLPFVQKARTGGYDGKGVQVVKNNADLAVLFDTPCVIEDLVDIEKEIAIITVRNQDGQIQIFPAVEMVFDPEINLIDYQFAPARLEDHIVQNAEKIALNLTKQLNIVGLLAIEMFLDKSGQLLVNEAAPRPHNSGHHTIEACNYSQYDMHLRAIQNKELHEIKLLKPAVMLNLIGSGDSGKATYSGLEKHMRSEEVFVHLYNKSISKPGRKMGHITILGDNLDEVEKQIDDIKSSIVVFGKNKNIVK